MKTLIVYAGKYGTTARIAGIIAQALAGQVQAHNLAEGPPPAPEDFERIVIGSSVYIGRIRKQAKAFCVQNKAVLLQKQLALFLCSGMPQNSEQYYKDNFDEALLQHASPKASFSGEFLVEKMGFLDKKMIAAVAKGSGMEAPQLDEQAVRAFAAALGQAGAE